MKKFLPTIILRHRRENLKKCSLRGLESHTDLEFHTYPVTNVATLAPKLEGYCLLHIDGEPIQKEDLQKGLLLIDCNWIHVDKMAPQKVLQDRQMTKRSIPPEWKTAYPRRQTHCDDPDRGLATVEALFIFWAIAGEIRLDFLEHYRWKRQFLERNSALLEGIAFNAPIASLMAR